MALVSLTSVVPSTYANILPTGRQSDIDSAGITSTDALVVILGVDGRETRKHGFSVKNTHATNIVQWQISGSFSDSATQPAQGDASWVIIKALGDITANNGTDIFTIVDAIYSWYKVEIKAKVGGSQGTVLIWHRGLVF